MEPEVRRSGLSISPRRDHNFAGDIKTQTNFENLFFFYVLQTALILLKTKRSKLPGKKEALSPWPGSPRGVQCVSLRHTLPTYAGGASGPSKARPMQITLVLLRCPHLLSVSVLSLLSL